MMMRVFAEAKTGLGEAGIIAVLGYCVVFVGLILLMLVVALMGKAMASRRKPETAQPLPEPPAAAAPEAVPQAKPQEAKGTGGQVLLHDVPEREAALVMAVVAYRLGKPLNQLRFQSIREVKDK